jgi:pyrroloquinoline quinone biosynthesis protein B
MMAGERRRTAKGPGAIRVSVETVLLGTAQDGGLPQAGCTCANCRAAWDDPSQRRRVACLGLIDRAARQCWLIDATPDLRVQWHELRKLALNSSLAGILLTHAHVGHYAGLIHLGREAWNTHELPVYASTRMGEFLNHNQPWSELIARGNIQLRELTPRQETQLSPALHALPLPVPHRDEHSDTLAFVLRGPQRRLLYCPDIDGWGSGAGILNRLLTGVDVALLDGTFFTADELPGRDLSQIPHPLAGDTAKRLARASCDAWLIHLNHSNPLNRPGAERNWLKARGVGVGACGQRWRL